MASGAKEVGSVTMVDRVIDSQLQIGKPGPGGGGRLFRVDNDCRRGDIVPVDYDVLRQPGRTRQEQQLVTEVSFS